MKTLFISNDSAITIVIPDEVYCNGSKEKGYTYHRRVYAVDVFLEERTEGYLNGNVKKHQMIADDIIRLADQIKEIRLKPATKEEQPEDLYGF